MTNYSYEQKASGLMQKATFDLPMYFDGATTPNDLGSGRLHITLD